MHHEPMKALLSLPEMTNRTTVLTRFERALHEVSPLVLLQEERSYTYSGDHQA